jgi:hypothetical protein
MYLGDAVYATFDGYHIWLRTSDGEHTTNKIALEPGVLNTLDLFRKQLQMPDKADEDCHCPENAELHCISVTCPRK